MGKPWHGKGKGSHGHSDHGGLGMLHGIARRYQEQQQLSMLGPMLASAGFGQPQGPLPPTFSCPQPQVAPMMHPPMQPMPPNPHSCYQQPSACLQPQVPAQRLEPCIFGGSPASMGNNDESTSSIMSTLTSIGSSMQKLLTMFSNGQKADSLTKPTEDAESAKSAMKGEPTELLHDLLRIANTKSADEERKAGTGKGTRKRAPPKQMDEAAVLALINDVLHPSHDVEEDDKPSAALPGAGTDEEGDAKARLAKKLVEAINSGTLAPSRKRAKPS